MTGHWRFKQAPPKKFPNEDGWRSLLGSSRWWNVPLQQVAEDGGRFAQEGCEVVRLEMVDVIGSVEQLAALMHGDELVAA